MRGALEFDHLLKNFIDRRFEEEKLISNISEITHKTRGVLTENEGKSLKHDCLRQMGAKKNFMHRGFKPLTMKLTGHTNTIRSIDTIGNNVLTGGEDNQAIIWDIKTKKGRKFTEHMNWVTKVCLLEEYAVSGGSDRAIWIRNYKDTESKSYGYKHDGWITGISKLTEDKILTCSDDGKLIAYD